MKSYHLVILHVLLIVFLFTACSDLESDIDSEDAKKTIQNFFTALSTADTLLLNQVTTGDFTLYEHEEIWNRDSLLSLMSATEGRIWEIQDFESISRENIAHVYYYNISRNPEGRSWLESALLIRNDGRTQIQFMHSTKLYLSN
ncbi:MAG: hypothetical protein U5J95_08120 [Balneolaceae bacterium]|nr:hypothetical protein [Balneolaceae bacterium]